MDTIKMTMATMTGNWAEAQRLAKDGYPLNEGDGQSGFRHACRAGQLETVKVFLEKGADINYADPSSMGSTPLQSACFAGDLEMVNFLIGKGARVNDKDEMANTPLIVQISGPTPKLEVVECLLKNGANPNEANEEGRPAIVVAKVKGLTAIVACLLDNKAKDEEPTEQDWSNAESPEDYGEEEEGEGEEPNAENEEGDEDGAMVAARQFNMIGVSYLYYDEDYEAAIEYFNNSIAACENYKNPYYNLYVAYTKSGQTEEAEKYKKIYKEKFNKNVEDEDPEKIMEEQEEDREELLYSLPNVSVVRLSGL